MGVAIGDQTLEYPRWMYALTQQQRDEIELAQYYAALGHHSEGHDRLILIATLAQLLDRSTGTEKDASLLGVGDAGQHMGLPQEKSQEDLQKGQVRG